MAFTLSSFGAAGEVTGSKHLLETESGSRILLDCGMFQGKREEATHKNCHFGFEPSSINAVILSHAHIDHIGLVPKLVKDGFKGPVYATDGTVELASPMLLDCAKIQEEDERFIFQHHIPNPFHDIIPLYIGKDIPPALAAMVAQNYEKNFEVSKDVTAEFFDAGHVFGSAITVLNVKTKQGRKKIVFTGDLGRANMPILKDPTLIAEADILIIESTYGDRSHERVEEVDDDLSAVINKTVKRGGKIFIPAFALERTQEMIIDLEKLMRQKKIPNLAVYVDSPLASKITKIFKEHPEYYDENTRAEFKKNHDLFSFDNLRFTDSVDDSKRLNQIQMPCIIIAGSGMMESGRIRHHLKNNIEDPRNSFLIVGYQAAQTLGRKLLEGRKVISIFGEDYRVNADIVPFKAFSAHADQGDLDDYVKRMKGLQKIFLVHGEETSRQAFASRLHGITKAEVILPKFGVSYDLE